MQTIQTNILSQRRFGRGGGPTFEKATKRISLTLTVVHVVAASCDRSGSDLLNPSAQIWRLNRKMSKQARTGGAIISVGRSKSDSSVRSGMFIARRPRASASSL